eukprot:4699902-Pleurochrysis_carterae.AAC.1
MSLATPSRPGANGEGVGAEKTMVGCSGARALPSCRACERRLWCVNRNVRAADGVPPAAAHLLCLEDALPEEQVHLPADGAASHEESATQSRRGRSPTTALLHPPQAIAQYLAH